MYRNLSNEDLVEYALGVKTDRDILDLARLNEYELARFPGVGKKKAQKIMAVFELSRRIQYHKTKRTQITSAEDVVKFMTPILRDERQECLYAVYLSSSNCVIDHVMLTKGDISSSIVSPLLVFKGAIDRLAKSVILVHNHPSGNNQPSREDLEITRTIKKGGELLNINLLDHIIIAGNSFTSLASDGNVL